MSGATARTPGACRVGPDGDAEAVLGDDEVAIARADRVARVDEVLHLGQDLGELEVEDEAKAAGNRGDRPDLEALPRPRTRHRVAAVRVDVELDLGGRERREDELVDAEDELEGDGVE